MLTHEASFNALFDAVHAEKGTINEKSDGWRADLLRRRICKLILYLEQDGKCCFCERQMYADPEFGRPPQGGIATIEHVVCKFNGGKNEIDNYKLSCYSCNNKRGVIEFDVFLDHVRNGTPLPSKPSMKNILPGETIEQRKKRFLGSKDNRAMIVLALSCHYDLTKAVQTPAFTKYKKRSFEQNLRLEKLNHRVKKKVNV